MKKLIRNFINKRNYEIIKQPYRGDKYPNLSKNKEEYYCETPIGKFYLPTEYEQDAVANTLVRGKFFEPEIIEAAKRYITNGSTVIDLGANFGSMTIAFSNFVGESGKVYSIEAQKLVFDFLQKNIMVNKCTNVELINNAVHNEEGVMVFFPKVDFSSSSKFKGAPFSGNVIIGNKEDGIPVKTITVDSLNIETKVSFIKVDVQGADLFALQGAKQTILKHKPVIIFEFEQPIQKQFNTTFHNYVEFVSSIDYKFVEIISQVNFVILPNHK